MSPDTYFRSSLYRTLFRLLPIAMAVTVGAFGLAAFTLIRHNADTQHAQQQTCIQVERLKTIIRQTLTRSKEGLPKITYYRTHPAELADARAEIERELRSFRPLDCN